MNQAKLWDSETNGASGVPLKASECRTLNCSFTVATATATATPSVVGKRTKSIPSATAPAGHGAETSSCRILAPDRHCSRQILLLKEPLIGKAEDNWGAT
jgi:hypothetical protein